MNLLEGDPTFVTRKVTMGLNDIIIGKKDKLVLGNLDAKKGLGAYQKMYMECG